MFAEDIATGEATIAAPTFCTGASTLPLRQTPANISYLLPVATRRSLADDVFIRLRNNVKSSLILFGTLPIGFMEILNEL